MGARCRPGRSALRSERENRRYLPGVALARRLAVSAEPGEPLPRLAARQRPGDHRHADGGPARDAVAACAMHRGPSPGCARASKRPRTCRRACSATRSRPQVAPGLAAGVLSGPSFAQEVARGQPTALVAASGDAAGARGAGRRPSTAATCVSMPTTTLPGVEVGGAVKNVLAIATGLCDGLNLGLNARAALITRGPGRDDAPGRGAGRARRRPSWVCRGWATWCSPPPAT